ncbi:hypothetical protein DSL72_005587 [Monilinia vaccinii-corymbosi]|uniref:Uncharacterized protein n=1 Tax=Monilinia vaccinii-corymbosi TaxID=61207 RepID=A0A8A3PFJ8_9HELO|nr:hypothetical protein DSL72_005587 [Monilinia vaccinii-corymbosi]
MANIQQDDMDPNPKISYNGFQKFRYPTIRRVENEGGSLYLSQPSHNMVDVFCSALHNGKPPALCKLLDLNTPRFFFRSSFPERPIYDFYIERSWQHLRVASESIALSYHIHHDGLWQLLAADRSNHSSINSMDWMEHCTDEQDTELGQLRRCAELAEFFLNIFMWNPQELEKADVHCYITTREGRRMKIEEFDTSSTNDVNVARVGSEVTKANAEAMVKITSELAEITEALRKTSEELSASKKRKRGDD